MNKTEVWTAEDAQLAALQGWNVFDVWDQDKKRCESAILRDPKNDILPSEEIARYIVNKRATAGDALANKALKVVFCSKVGDIPKKSRRSKA